MKIFTKYISKYLLSFIGLILALIALNAAAFVFTFYSAMHRGYGTTSPQHMSERIAAASSAEKITPEAKKILTDHGLWAMYLNPEGICSWTAALPEEIPTAYSIQEIAIFSRGYLKDYPVFVWSKADGLLVIGYPKNSYMKLTGNYFPIAALRKFPLFFACTLLFDLLVLFLAYFRSRTEISKNTEPVISSIAALAEGKSIRLSVNGELSEIAGSINQVSDIISRQNRARANWISGVSHDIRTPLSMIMGYAQRIAADPAAHRKIREQAAVISKQSVKIKDLIQDLNLVSRLEYEMQPLEKTPIRLSKLLRSYAVDLINGGLEECYSIEVTIAPVAEGRSIPCDAKLITRAVNNLVQNSIHSNPGGCSIALSLDAGEGQLILTVRDNGVGISAERLEELKQKPHYMESTDERLDLRHGLGLLLVRQIIEVHEGNLAIDSRPGEGYQTRICFPC